MTQNREESFTTDQIDPASFITVKLEMPIRSYDSVTGRVQFTFPNRDLALKALMMYESGGECCAKALLSIRSFLYKEIERLKSGGRK
jgi:hypothetical protein